MASPSACEIGHLADALGLAERVGIGDRQRLVELRNRASRCRRRWLHAALTVIRWSQVANARHRGIWAGRQARMKASWATSAATVLSATILTSQGEHLVLVEPDQVAKGVSVPLSGSIHQKFDARFDPLLLHGVTHRSPARAQP